MLHQCIHLGFIFGTQIQVNHSDDFFQIRPAQQGLFHKLDPALDVRLCRQPPQQGSEHRVRVHINPGAEATGKTGGDVIPVPPPPSYTSVVPQGNGGGVIAAPAGGMLPRQDSNGGVVVAPHAPTEWNRRQPSAAAVTAPREKTEVIPFRKLRQRLGLQYQELKKRNMVEVFLLDTYQGRLSCTPGKDSTNGCAVISPLVASQHLKNSGAVLPDAIIERVIDDAAPPILRAVRSKLGLGGAALIIPSDVHDYLVDNKILRQDTFVGVGGGNILDSKHLGALIDMLQNGDENKDHKMKKTAATLFFREHVISMLKVAHSNGETWFDIVDSLPHPTSRNGGNGAPRASRTRCKDRDSLELTLKWYACSKFGESDRNYIDNNLWDEVMCDFDPRVFQGFVWAAE